MVTIKLSSSVLYNSFLTQTPPRLVMELLDVKHEGPTQSMKGKGLFLAGVRSSQFEKTPRLITRVVMDLVKMAGYKVGTTAGGLTVQLVGSVEDEKSASAPPPAAAPAPAAPKPVAVKPVVAKRAAAAAAPKPAPAEVPVAAATAAAAPAATVNAIDAAASLSALPATAKAPPEAAPKPKQRINITAAQAMRRAGLDATMTTELAASAQASDITKTNPGELGDVDDWDRGSRQTGGRIFRDIMSRLPRDTVTLDFDNTDIRDVIRLLAAKAKINIVFGPDVAGSLTLHLVDVPFNEAFRTALSMMKLTTDQVGDNILRVITPAELTKQRTSSTAITKVYVLNYAKASEVKATIDAVRTAEGRMGNSTADVKTNTLIVTDSLEGQLSTENLISQMDQRPRQVLIEAKIVEINANAGLNYGVQWDYQGIQQGRIGGQQGQNLVGTTANPSASASPIRAPLDQNANLVAGVGASGRGTGVALAADRVFGAFTFGRITNNFILNATLTAAASEGKAKILSEPKIATLNNQAANINVTTQIPYVTSNVASTGVQTQTVSYVTTGIKLTVTPSINADGRITLQVNPDISQPSTTAAGSTQTGAPAVDSRNATTTVLVRDGETIVIGGLITDTMQDTISKIPLLGDIPILGWLFKKKTKTRVRAELLIFVTTRLLPD
ncbi:MAG: type IV pilus secretin PilQ [Elusimicrobiota bacterium]|nr:MAG: type IV pilus secretin PilQ [Elusimicrobiota bacterium]